MSKVWIGKIFRLDVPYVPYSPLLLFMKLLLGRLFCLAPFGWRMTSDERMFHPPLHIRRFGLSSFFLALLPPFFLNNGCFLCNVFYLLISRLSSEDFRRIVPFSRMLLFFLSFIPPGFPEAVWSSITSSSVYLKVKYFMLKVGSLR